MCLQPYLKILNDWVQQGEDDLSTHDFRQEFFIKANTRLFANDGGNEEANPNQSARKQWTESYVFRTIDISKLLGQSLGQDFDKMLNKDEEDINQEATGAKTQIELSCPLFLRPVMKQILSVGKSIKIIRFLQNNIFEQLKRSKLSL